MNNWILGSGLLSVFGSWLIFVISTNGNQLRTNEIIEEAGYPCEEHKIETEDGYILTAFRIPHGRGQELGQRPVILLQHGLTGSSDNFVHIRQEKSLAFFLADKGFDVWIGNIRGNIYSDDNIHYRSSNKKFWDFSWDDMGYFDIPATISYILNNTKQEKIYYAGHSMGSNMLMVLLTRRPEFQRKIELAFVLAPAVYVADGRSMVFSFFCKYYAPLTLQMLGPNGILPSNFNKFQSWFSPQCSTQNKITSSLCKLIYTLTNGPTTDILQSSLPFFLSSNPNQASAKSLAHFGQAISSGEFKAYDYGKKENLKKYGSSEPTKYNLEEVQTPVVIMYSDSDYIAPPSDAHKLCLRLPRVPAFYRVPLKTFNHMDFLYGNSAKELVYEEMFKILSSDKSRLVIKADCNNTDLH